MIKSAIYFKIDQELKKQFQITCINNNVQPTHKIRNFIEDYVNKERLLKNTNNLKEENPLDFRF